MELAKPKKTPGRRPRSDDVPRPLMEIGGFETGGAEPQEDPALAAEPAALPEPGRAFLWIGEADDGLVLRGGDSICIVCDPEQQEVLANPEAHVESKNHKKWKADILHALGEIKKKGHTLEGEGVSIRNMKFHCRHCDLADWYGGAFDHVQNRRHQKSSWQKVRSRLTPRRRSACPCLPSCSSCSVAGADQEDPRQQGAVDAKESAEVKSKHKGEPVDKGERAKYCDRSASAAIEAPVDHGRPDGASLAS